MPEHVAVVIGINYEAASFSSRRELQGRAGLNPLRWAEDDAQEIAVVLREAGYDVALLLGQAATRDAIIDALDRQCRSMTPNGLFLVHFAGHGDVDWRNFAYLLPAGVDPEQLAAQGIPLEDLAGRYLPDNGSSVVLLDCCHSGYAVGVRGQVDKEAVARGKVQSFLDRTKASFLQVQRRAVLAACDGSDEAWELPHLRHGAFTHYVLQYWRDTPDEIHVELLYRAVDEGLKHARLPSPVFAATLQGSVILRSARPQPAPSPPPVSPLLTVADIARREQLYDVINSLEDAHWFALLTDLGIEEHTLTGTSRVSRTRALILDWANAGLLRPLEDKAQAQAAYQIGAMPQNRASNPTRSMRQESFGQRLSGLVLRSQVFVLSANKDWNALIKLGERALAQDPQNEAVRSSTVNAYLSRGDTYSDEQRYEDALVDYTRAVQLDPKNVRACLSRGDTHYNQQCYDQALVDYIRVIHLDPQNVRAYLGCGDIYYNQQRYDEALIAYTKVIHLDPDNRDAHYYRGGVYCEQQLYKEALADYTCAIELDPNFALAYMGRSTTHRQLGQIRSATLDHARARRLDPDIE